MNNSNSENYVNPEQQLMICALKTLTISFDRNLEYKKWNQI